MLVLLAQMGSFVPAESLRFGLVDRIYTRIGASDKRGARTLDLHGGDDRNGRRF